MSNITKCPKCGYHFVPDEMGPEVNTSNALLALLGAIHDRWGTEFADKLNAEPSTTSKFVFIRNRSGEDVLFTYHSPAMLGVSMGRILFPKVNHDATIMGPLNAVMDEYHTDWITVHLSNKCYKAHVVHVDPTGTQIEEAIGGYLPTPTPTHVS